KERYDIDHDIKVANNKVNELSIKAFEIEAAQKKAEIEALKSSWVTLHKNYYAFLENLSTNELCPLCSQDLESSFVEKKLKANDQCILCSQSIKENSSKPNSNRKKTDKLEAIHNIIHQYQNDIYEYESKLKELDKEFQDNKI